MLRYPFVLLFATVVSSRLLAGSSETLDLDALSAAGDGVKPFASPSEFTLPKGLDSVDPDYRETWARLTGFEDSGLHWNHFVVIYVNQHPQVYTYNYSEYVKHFAEDAWGMDEATTGPAFKHYEEKTVFLKEHYISEKGKPAPGTFLTLMEKMPPGYDPDFGDWRYTWIDGRSGQVLQDGNSENRVLYKSCIECHANMADRDYIFSTFSRSEK